MAYDIYISFIGRPGSVGRHGDNGARGPQGNIHIIASIMMIVCVSGLSIPDCPPLFFLFFFGFL
jgi:hypothetical protein